MSNATERTRESDGRLVLEASTGMHGAEAQRLAELWARQAAIAQPAPTPGSWEEFFQDAAAQPASETQLSEYRCSECKTRLFCGADCHVCGSFSAEDIYAAASAAGPKELWLQLHGDCTADELLEPVDYTDDSVTWCWHAINDNDVRYVRADLAQQPAAEPVATTDEFFSKGYVKAFYEIGKLLGISARADTPENVFRNEILPKLKALTQPIQPKPVAWMLEPITQRHPGHHFHRSCVTTEPTEYKYACAAIDGDRYVPLYALAQLVQPAPAPGYCKNCKDYTIEEPLIVQPAPRGTDAQIGLERELTASAIVGAMAYGYQNGEYPPDDAAWLRPFWEMGRRDAERESALAQPVQPAAKSMSEAECELAWASYAASKSIDAHDLEIKIHFASGIVARAKWHQTVSTKETP